MLVVTFFEDYEEIYEWANTYRDTSIETVSSEREDKSAGKNLENVIKLKKDKNDEWMIVDHIVYVMVVKKQKKEYLEKLKPFGEIFKSQENKGLALFYPNKNSDSSSSSLRPVGGKYEIKEIESDQEDETGNTINSNSMLLLEGRSLKSLTSWVWNSNAAGTYADLHAIHYSSNYRAYGEDCTNFASQALYAGGKPYRDGAQEEYPPWYYGMFSFTTSYTWTGAMFLATHLWGYTNSDLFPTSIFQIDRGDLIFFDFTNDGIIDHTMIISYVVYNENNPNAYVNGHTTDRYRKNLLDLLSEMAENHPNLVLYIAVIGNQYTDCPQCP